MVAARLALAPIPIGLGKLGTAIRAQLALPTAGPHCIGEILLQVQQDEFLQFTRHVPRPVLANSREFSPTAPVANLTSGRIRPSHVDRTRAVPELRRRCRSCPSSDFGYLRWLLRGNSASDA